MTPLEAKYLAEAGAEAAVNLFSGDSKAMYRYRYDHANGSGDAKVAAAFVLEYSAYALADLLAQVKASGRATFTPEMPTRAQMHYMKFANPEGFYGAEGLSLLVSATESLRKVMPGIMAVFNNPAESTKQEQKSSVADVQKVEIVSMPQRVTEVTVERDPETQEITKTTSRQLAA